MSQPREFELRVRPLSEQGSEDDLRGRTVEELIEMVWPLTVDAWTFKEGSFVESRLPRHVVRLVRGGR